MTSRTIFFFFSSRRRHTRSLRDWSSDVCSSDLARMSFGAHSRTHASLPGLEQDALGREVHGCRAELETALGAPVRLFAYPYGERDERVEAEVEAAGFVAACGIEPGRNRPNCEPFALRRLEVRGTDSLLRFALTLWLGDTRAFRRGRRSR